MQSLKIPKKYVTTNGTVMDHTRASQAALGGSECISFVKRRYVRQPKAPEKQSTDNIVQIVHTFQFFFCNVCRKIPYQTTTNATVKKTERIPRVILQPLVVDPRLATNVHKTGRAGKTKAREPHFHCSFPSGGKPH